MKAIFIVSLILIVSIFLILKINPPLVLNPHKSLAEIFIENDKLNIKFSLESSEKADAQKFADNLGTKAHWLGGISLDLDQNSLNKIAKNLPSKVKIDFEGKKVSFRSSSLPNLANPLSVSSYTFSTGSGQLIFNGIDENNYYFSIYNPKPLLVEATSSSKITLSTKLNDLFPILSKISKIEMRVFGKNISGEITLNGCCPRDN